MDAKKTVQCPIVNSMESAIASLGSAYKDAKGLKGCPEQVISRILNLKISLTKSTVSVNNRLAGMDAKAERTFKAGQRKAERLSKLVTKQAKLAEQIKALEE